jgi:hypothetical protein
MAADKKYNNGGKTWGGLQAGLMSAMSGRYQDDNKRVAGSRRYIPAMSEDQKTKLSKALEDWREARDSDPWVAKKKEMRQDRKERRLADRYRRKSPNGRPMGGSTNDSKTNDYVDTSKLKLSDEELMSNLQQYLKGLR